MRGHAQLRFTAVLAAAWIALSMAPQATAQPRPGTVQPSASERLAMLAERIGKSHLQVAQGVLADRSRRALRESVREFDALLPSVARLANDPESRDNAVLLGLLWKELRAWAQKPATRENARKVSERAEEVSWIATKGATLAKPEGAAQRSALAAVRAATLAQRVGRLYLLEWMGAADERRHADLADAKARLAAALGALAAGPHDGALDVELGMAGTQHEFLVSAARDYEAGGGAAAIVIIAKTTDNIADAMQRVMRLYENAAG